jgi:hypothetical protein
VRKLKELFRDTDEAVLIAAVLDALAIVGSIDQSMIDQILTSKGLQHADPTVRSKALDFLRRVAVDKVRIETLAKLNLDDPSPEVRNRALKALNVRIGYLIDADIKDIRSLLQMTANPDTVQIGLAAAKRLGPRAKEAVPELLKLFSAANNMRKLELAMVLIDINPKDYTAAKTVSPVLVAALRPKNENDRPSEAVLESIKAIGQPVVVDIFKALENADDIGVVNAAYRKALYLALQELGREAYSEENVHLLRKFRRKERYRDVQDEAGRALHAMRPTNND